MEDLGAMSRLIMKNLLNRDDKKKKMPSDLEKLKEDAKFQFLSIHQKRAQVATWSNDALNTELPGATTKPASDYLNFNSDSDSG
ncbi:Probable RNA-binding protein 19 [Lemmus lemmus]